MGSKVYCAWEQDEFDSSEFSSADGWLHRKAGAPWHNKDGYATDDDGVPLTGSEHAEKML